MLIKSDPDTIQPFLSDASFMRTGAAERVFFPEDATEVAEVLKAASRDATPVTVSGAGTGTVGGRIPTSGFVIATDKLNKIANLENNGTGGGSVVAEAGVRLADVQHAAERAGLLYAPDPTERSCYLGGTLATNASGARTFKYGPTRNHVLGLRVVLSTGEEVNISRGEIRASTNGEIRIPLNSGRTVTARLPSYAMPHTRKHAAGYYVAPEMDAIDLFIGSEGTLGVIVEAEVSLLPRPNGLLSGIVFFDSEDRLLTFVDEARTLSLNNRRSSSDGDSGGIDARALEYFDFESLKFLRAKYELVPDEAVGAIFFEQETTASNEDELSDEWLALIEKHDALGDKSWFATSPGDHVKLREFRHALPVLMNEWFARHNQRKVSTDMSVPDKAFPSMLCFYRDTLRTSNLRYTIFGHIGDNHVHVNILPRDDGEATSARDIYLTFVKKAVEVGGTISAEHGIGKLKREYLKMLYSEQHLREMAALKRAIDPAGILGRGNIFSEEYL